MVPAIPTMAGGDDLAALHEQVALASSDLDLAFQLQHPSLAPLDQCRLPVIIVAGRPCAPRPRLILQRRLRLRGPGSRPHARRAGLPRRRDLPHCPRLGRRLHPRRRARCSLRARPRRHPRGTVGPRRRLLAAPRRLLAPPAVPRLLQGHGEQGRRGPEGSGPRRRRARGGCHAGRRGRSCSGCRSRWSALWAGA